MNIHSIRSESLTAAGKLGYETSDALPFLHDDIRLVRSMTEVVERALCGYAAVAAAYGFDRARSLAWVCAEGIDGSLTREERAFLRGDSNSTDTMKKRVEAMYALAWSIGFVAQIDFSHVCPPTLVQVFPNIKVGETAARFRESAQLASDTDVARNLDLAYCIHWAVVEAAVQQRRGAGPLAPYVIVERRRALEWLVSDDDFEDVTLDT